MQQEDLRILLKFVGQVQEFDASLHPAQTAVKHSELPSSAADFFTSCSSVA